MLLRSFDLLDISCQLHFEHGTFPFYVISTFVLFILCYFDSLTIPVFFFFLHFDLRTLYRMLFRPFETSPKIHFDLLAFRANLILAFSVLCHFDFHGILTFVLFNPMLFRPLYISIQVISNCGHFDPLLFKRLDLSP